MIRNPTVAHTNAAAKATANPNCARDMALS